MEVIVERVSDPKSVDFGALFSLLRSAFAYMDGRIDPPSSLHRMTISDLHEKAATEILFLAHDGDRMVGCLFAKPEADFVYIGKVAVLPKAAFVGIGTTMMKAALTHAKELGTHALELETRVDWSRITRFSPVSVLRKSAKALMRATTARPRSGCAHW